MPGVLIDTSAWIVFFRKGTGPVADEVAALVERDEAWITGPVITELLHGTRSARERRDLGSLLGILPYADAQRADWEQAGEVLRALRERGVTVPLCDALIAVVAHRNALPVLTTDKHFDHLPARPWQPEGPR